MKNHKLSVLSIGIASLALSVSAQAAYFDFQQWVDVNGAQGFDNNMPFELTVDSLTLIATALESPGSVDSHVYMDGMSNGTIGGMGVCSTLDGSFQCSPDIDDNVSVDGGNAERLIWDFDQILTEVTLELGDYIHDDFTEKSLEYRYGNQGWMTVVTDVNAMVTIALDGDSNTIRFRTAGAELVDEFYIRNADVSTVPVPAAVWLFGSGLIGLIGIARRKK